MTKTVEPSTEIDKAVKDMLKLIKPETPPDTVCKIITTAISWEKAKHSINDEREPFDPDTL
jgi:hypothetical protein